MSAPVPMPADFPKRALTTCPTSLKRHYGVGWRTIDRWALESGVTPPSGKHFSEKKPAPADLAANARKMHFEGLCRHYGKNQRLMRRWLNELGVAARSFNASAQAKKQWEENPIRPRTERKPSPKGRTVLPAGVRQAPRDSSRAGDAADYLKRWFVPVYRCDDKGELHHRGTSTHYRLGSAIVTTEAMLETAKRKGWNPDAWMEIAA